jgi:hypothetical protein
MSIWITCSGEVESLYHAEHSRPTTWGPHVVDTYLAKGGGYGHMCMRDVRVESWGGVEPGTELLMGSGTRIRDIRPPSISLGYPPLMGPPPDHAPEPPA